MKIKKIFLIAKWCPEVEISRISLVLYSMTYEKNSRKRNNKEFLFSIVLQVEFISNHAIWQVIYSQMTRELNLSLYRVTRQVCPKRNVNICI